MATSTKNLEVPIEDLDVSAYEIPTDFPESDGTLAWDSTTIVVVEARGGEASGIGYTYADATAARLIVDQLAPVVRGRDVSAVPAAWLAMSDAVRNLGNTGLTQMAIAAVDVALWDLKARLLDVPMVVLLGAWHERVPVYGSGGFTSYPVERLQDQLSGWVESGIPRVKMKVGRAPDEDLSRVQAARKAVGDRAELFIDANGAYGRKQALAKGFEFADFGVTWYEEPVTSDDLDGLRMLRDRCPPAVEIAAGEYGYGIEYFRRMTDAGAVDVLQPDVTRCGGITGFLRIASLCEIVKIPLSAHTAPSLSAHVCAAARPLRHVEYFHDHVRIERMLFDGILEPTEGDLIPDRSRPGLGLELKRADAKRFLVFGRDD